MTKAIAAAVVIVITMWAVGCHGSSTAPSPGVTPPPGVTPTFISLAIQGPSRIAPGETAQFTATATMSDRTMQDYTTKVNWVAYPNNVLTVTRDTGQVTGVASGDAHVSVTAPSDCWSGCHPNAAITVLPPNTYRLTGKVVESGLPVQGATVTVLSGTGSGLSSATRYDGQYGLYGVAGTVQIKVTKAGYEDLVKTISVMQNDVLDFPEARQSQRLPSIAGPYVLTLQPDPGCSTESFNNIPALPSDLRQPRSYAVQLSQDGPSLHVAGAAPMFLPPSDHFDGRIKPDGIEFQFGDGYIGYGPNNAFTAHLSPTQALSYEGLISAAQSGSAIVGRLDGEVQAFDVSALYRFIGDCRASNHKFAMTVVNGPLR